MYQKILIAIEDPSADHSPYRQGIDLAEKLGASVMLLHVLFPGEGNAPMPPGDDLFFVPAFMPDEALLLRYQTAWQEYIDSNLERLKVLGELAMERKIPTEWSQNSGSPGKVICQLARTWGADLVVVGHRHQSAISEMFMGSVSNYVMHHAPCAVLVAQVEGAEGADKPPAPAAP